MYRLARLLAKRVGTAKHAPQEHVQQARDLLDTALWTTAQLVRTDLRSRRLLRHTGLLRALDELLRAGQGVYGDNAIQQAAEIVLAFVKTDVEGCSMLFDLGIVRYIMGYTQKAWADS